MCNNIDNYDVHNYDDNTLYTYSRDFHQVQEYLKNDFEILENWFYGNLMVPNTLKKVAP